MTDIDLHVTEPNGEVAYYGNNRTKIGGCVSRDFTRGYGPEEYMIKNAMPGKYKIQAKYYSNSRQDMSGATSLLLTLSTGFGKPNNEVHNLTAVRLSTNQSMVDVGEFEVKGT
jgi:Ca-activated chloride channel family protein